VARRSAVKQRTRLASQMKSVVVTAPDNLRVVLAGLTAEQLAAKCARFRPAANISDPYTAAKTALKMMAIQYQQLGVDIDQLTGHYQSINDEHAPDELTDMVGVGPVVAADLIITWGITQDRITTESAFAAVCGVSAVEASSGQFQRHRLNRGGDRQANAALYRIVIVRLKYDTATQTYMQRRLGDQRSKKEIIRCLKRYVARDIYWIFKRHKQATCDL
jgi:transposase